MEHEMLARHACTQCTFLELYAHSPQNEVECCNRLRDQIHGTKVLYLTENVLSGFLQQKITIHNIITRPKLMKGWKSTDCLVQVKEQMTLKMHVHAKFSGQTFRQL